MKKDLLLPWLEVGAEVEVIGRREANVVPSGERTLEEELKEKLGEWD